MVWQKDFLAAAAFGSIDDGSSLSFSGYPNLRLAQMELPAGFEHDYTPRTLLLSLIRVRHCFFPLLGNNASKIISFSPSFLVGKNYSIHLYSWNYFIGFLLSLT